MCNLIKFSDNYSKTTGNLLLFFGDVVDFPNINTTGLYRFKKITYKTGNDATQKI